MGVAGIDTRDLREAMDMIWLQVAPRPPARILAKTPDATPSDGPDPYGNPDPEWMRTDWTQHMRTKQVSGVPISYVDWGPVEEKGTRFDVVFVHGLSGSWQNWLENIPHFARHHRVLALDLPGFGQTPLPEEEISIEYFGRLVLEFCREMGVRDCVIVGNSMGGFVAAEAAIRSPDRFERLVLVSAAGISHARMRREPAEVAGRMAMAAAPLAFRYADRAFRRPRIRQAAFRGLFHRPELLRGELILEQWGSGAGAPGFLAAIDGLVGYDFLDRLEEVEVPALIVWGRNDRVVPAVDAVGYAQRLRNSRMVVFDETGHVPQLERPVRFNRLLEDFLNS